MDCLVIDSPEELLDKLLYEDVYKRQVDDSALALIALRFLEGFLQQRCGVTVPDRLLIDLLGQKND